MDREKIIIEKLEYLSGQQISKIAESFLALGVVAKMLHCCCIHLHILRVQKEIKFFRCYDNVPNDNGSNDNGPNC